MATQEESVEERASRLLNKLKSKYPGKNVLDLDGRGKHFVCELEPTADHPEYDRAIEIIIDSKPHKHLRMTQYYKVLSGSLQLHVNDKIVVLNAGDSYVVNPGDVHWAQSNDECWLEIYSEPGWTQADHIPVQL